MSSDSLATEPPDGVRDDRLDQLEQKIEALQGGLDRAWETIDDRDERIAALEEENAELREEIATFREEHERLDARTDLLRLVENSDQLTGKQRSVALIQNLRRAAEKQRERGKKALASVNREEAERALQHPDVDRTTIYQDMKRAARLVGNEDVLWYQSETGGESRLKLNLERGSLPGSIRGQTTDNGGEEL